MPRGSNDENRMHNSFYKRNLNQSVQNGLVRLQNAGERQILPIYEGKPLKQKLPRQILPIRIYPDLSAAIRPSPRPVLKAESATSSGRVVRALVGLPGWSVPTRRRSVHA